MKRKLSRRKFMKRLLPFILTLVLIFTSGGILAFANLDETDPEYNHGTIAVTAEGDLEMEVGDELVITLSPYIHMQYAGCQMNGCPAICGGYDCFTPGLGCSCAADEDPVIRTADVTVTSSNTNVVTSTGEVTAADGTVTEVGDMLDGTVTVTAVGGGTATVTVRASLCDWESVSQKFSITVTGDSLDDGQNEDDNNSDSDDNSGSEDSSGSEDGSGSGDSSGSEDGSGSEDSNGSEDGSGSGDSSGSDDGSGDSSGSEDGGGSGDSSGSEDGSGSGDSSGSDDGSGDGSGSGDSSGSGDGSGSGDSSGGDDSSGSGDSSGSEDGSGSGDSSGNGDDESQEAPSLRSTSATLRYTGATTGTTPTFDLYLSDGTSDWADSVTTVTIVDSRDGSAQILDEDQYAVTSSKISLIRTDEDPIMSVSTAERSVDFEIIVSSEGYEDLDETYTVTMYGAQTFQLRYLDGDGNVISSHTFTRDEIIEMSEAEEVYYNTICSMTGLRSFRAKGAYLSDLLDAAGITFSEGMTMVLRTNDMAEGENDSTTQDAYYSSYGTFTYEEMMGTARYAFTDIFTNDTLKADILAASKFGTDVRTLLGSAAQKEEVYPLISYNYIELQYPQTEGQSIYDYDYSELVGYENSFRFLFGIAMDEEDDSMISGTTTTWSASYAVFGIDIIDENYEGDSTDESQGDMFAVRRGNTFYFQETLDTVNSLYMVDYGRVTDDVLIGDWDGDGIDTVCVRRGNTCYFSNDASFTSTVADIVLDYGRETDEVLVGDWDGDGIDTLCVRRGNTCYFSNDASFTSTVADIVLDYGRSTDEMLIGDWDGDGTDTICARRGKVYYIGNDLVSATAATVLYYGRETDEVLAGDWNGDGYDTLCVRRGNAYYIRYDLQPGDADKVIYYGRTTDEVFVGRWK